MFAPLLIKAVANECLKTWGVCPSVCFFTSFLTNWSFALTPLLFIINESSTVLNKKSKTNQKKVSLISTEGNTIPEQLLKYIKQKNKPTTTEELVSFFCTKHKIKVLEGRGKVYIRLNTMKKRKQLISYKPEESKVKGSYWFLPEWLDNNGIPLPQYDIK